MSKVQNRRAVAPKTMFALAMLISVSALANGQSQSSRYASVPPKSVDYSKGRTWQNFYHKDPNKLSEFSIAAVNRRCGESTDHDFATPMGFGSQLSATLLNNNLYKDFNVVVLVRIATQQLFVLDRKLYNKTGDGLRYAWNTSTGFSDWHYGRPYYTRKMREQARMSGKSLPKFIFSQKFSVNVVVPSKEAALKTLKTIRWRKKATLKRATEGQNIYSSSRQKSLIYAVKKGFPYLTDFNDPLAPAKMVQLVEITRSKRVNGRLVRRNGVVVKERVLALRYTDYFHTQPGYYTLGNGFSSRHASSESDGAVSEEIPAMPWAVFFNQKRGMATHGTTYPQNMRTPKSHGCVRLHENKACRLFHLAGHSGRSKAIPSIDQETGALIRGKTHSGYRTLYIIEDAKDYHQSTR